MPTVEEGVRSFERLQTLVDSDVDVADLTDRRNTLKSLNRRIEKLLGPQTKPLTAKQAADQAEAAEKQAARASRVDDEAVKLLSNEANTLVPDNDQQFLARRTGELGAVIGANLDEEVTRQLTAAQREEIDPSEFEPYLTAVRAREILDAGELDFHTREGTLRDGKVPSAQFTPEQIEELRTDKGPIGSARNVVGGAVRGVLGAGGIAASALGAEGIGSTLAGAGRVAEEAIGTQDLAGRAAELEFGDIVQRAQLPDGDPNKLGIGEAMARAGQLAITNGDAFVNLLEGVGAAALGGGGLGVGARAAGAAARATGSVGTAAANTAGRVTSAVAPRGTGASFAGLGAGVDESLTTDQARITAGTGILAGQAGRFGATAETGLADIARRVTPGITAPVRRGTVGGSTSNLRNAATGTAQGAAVETGQEFVESGGESFATDAQTNDLGVIGTLTDPTAQRRALAAGAVSAPVGAALGGPIGAAGSVGQAGANRAATEFNAQNNPEAFQRAFQAEADSEAFNAENQAAAERQGQEELGDQIVAEERAARDARLQARDERLITEGIDAQTPVGAQFGADNSGFEVPGELEAAVQQRAQVLNQRATEREGVIQERGPGVRPSQIGQRAPVAATFSSEFFSGSEQSAINYEQFALQDAATQEADLRALYRNQPQLDPIAEDAFIQQMGDVRDLPTDVFEQRFNQALEGSNSEAALASIAEQNQARQSEAGDQATDAIDAQTPTVGQFSATRPADEQAPGEAEAEARAQARQAELDVLDSAVRSVPAPAAVPDPSVFRPEDLDGNGRLREPADLSQDINERRLQVEPQATLENTILADARDTVSLSGGGIASRPDFFHETFFDMPPEQRAAALEALATRSGLESEQAVTFAQAVGEVPSTAAQFQDRVRTALNTAQQAAEAVDVGLDPSQSRERELDNVVFTTNADGAIELAQTLDNPNSPIAQVLGDTATTPAVQQAQNQLTNILGENPDTSTITPANARQISEVLQQYERATGKKL